ncbi:thioredoxin family protein [Chitinophagaceae bacterium MMS25-I14]
MKRTILFLLAPLTFSIGAFAQGVQFETGNWQSVLDKAKKENKLIYMDVYTTWCGPCKILATQIFPQKEAGDKYNKLFVNYRIDAEKGEGLDIAKQYSVTGYPTNLFIDPATQAVVYRTMGASIEVKGFTDEADVAIAERNDPMTYEKYDAAFKSGKKDRKFLRSYLEKDKRLNKNNDALLNAYVAQLDKNHPADSEIYYLADMMQTVHNNALPLIAQNKSLLEKRYPQNKLYYKQMISGALYKTMEEAINTKDESLLPVIADAKKKYAPFEDEETVYWIRTQYYTKTEDSVKAFKAASEEADFLSAQPLSYYDTKDKEGLNEIRESVQEQLKMMKVPDNKIDSLTELNLQDPARRHSHSSATANTLNSLAWNVYEQHGSNKDMVKQALKWSEFSLQLAQPLTNEWPAYADTYAHLLYAAGRRDEAVKTQQSALDKGRAAKTEGIEDFEQTLKKMQAGTL